MQTMNIHCLYQFYSSANSLVSVLRQFCVSVSRNHTAGQDLRLEHHNLGPDCTAVSSLVSIEHIIADHRDATRKTIPSSIFSSATCRGRYSARRIHPLPTGRTNADGSGRQTKRRTLVHPSSAPQMTVRTTAGDMRRATPSHTVSFAQPPAI